MQKTGFFTKIIFYSFLFKVSAGLFNRAVCKIGLTVSYKYYIFAFREELRTRAHTCRIRQFFFQGSEGGPCVWAWNVGIHPKIS